MPKRTPGDVGAILSPSTMSPPIRSRCVLLEMAEMADAMVEVDSPPRAVLKAVEGVGGAAETLGAAEVLGVMSDMLQRLG